MRDRAKVLRAALVALASLGGVAAVAACGESRRPIGEECLRDEDCLSNVCAARTCVPQPQLVTGALDPPDDEEPRIPTDAGAPPIGDAGDEAE